MAVQAALAKDMPVRGVRCCASECKHAADKSRGGLPRFYLQALPKSQGLTTKLEGDEFFHMTKVLRLGVDESVELFNGRGGICSARISAVGKSCVELMAEEDPCVLPPEGASWHVVAAFATLQGGRADWLVEKCSELGARTLTPLLTERSRALLDRKNSRWQRLAVAAAKQCQRLHALELQESMNTRALARNVEKTELALLATAGAAPLAKALRSLKAEPRGGMLIVGPEGDFTDVEKDMLTSAGAIPVGLGPRRLRVETAAIAMLSTTTMLFDTTG